MKATGMKSDIEVTISGNLPFDESAVSGISVTYTYNALPIVRLTLDAPFIQKYTPDFLCNPDLYKNRDGTSSCEINIKTKKGCLKFTGLFDGLSASQTPGGFEYAAIIKSRFTRLLEVYPKFMGIVPGSMLPFKFNRTLKISENNNNYATLIIGGQAASIPVDISPPEFMIKLIKFGLKSQIDKSIYNVSYSGTFTDSIPLLELINQPVYKENAKAALTLLDDVNTIFVSDCLINSNKMTNNLLQMYIQSTDNVFNTMVETLTVMGCNILCGNDKIFIIPSCNFLKLGNNKVPKFQEQAKTLNHAYPADFSNFSVNDASYKNIKYAIVVPSSYSNIVHPGTSSITRTVMLNSGMYPRKDQETEIPDDGSSGVLVVPGDNFILQGVLIAGIHNRTILTDLKDKNIGYGADKKVESPTAVKDKHNEHQKAVLNNNNDAKTAMDAYAKTQFLSAKYNDRVGSFTSVFNPNWVPGTTGFLYTRTPGLGYNFFVTSVCHNITLSPNNNGQAVTTVNFNSVRSKGTPSDIPGVEEDPFYTYNADTMQNVQDSWVKDITGT
jgi:hypothetical protein